MYYQNQDSLVAVAILSACEMRNSESPNDSFSEYFFVPNMPRNGNIDSLGIVINKALIQVGYDYDGSRLLCLYDVACGEDEQKSSGMNCIKIDLPGKLILSKRKGLLEVILS